MGLLIPFSFIVVIIILVIQHIQKLNKLTGTGTLEEDKRPPVLYLRSFDSDGSGTSIPTIIFPAIVLLGNKLFSHEQQIANLARKIGPFIAIGKPGEQLPELGANRDYYKDDEWQMKILNKIENSALIILRPSLTEGVLWEIEQIITKGYTNKLIIFRHFEGDESKNVQKEKYLQFSKRIYDKFNIQLPEYHYLKHYIYFDETGIPNAVFNINNVPLYNQLLNCN